MRSYFAAFIQALILCAALTPLVRRLALRTGAVSSTGGRNQSIERIPRLGGIAIALSALAPMTTLIFIDSGVASFIRQRSGLAVGLLAGSLLVCGMGVVDDTRGLSARSKLAIQALAAVVAYHFGFRIDAVSVPLVGVLSMGVFSFPITALWIVGITNAVNLIDGLDGLAAGVVFCAALTNLVVAIATGVDSGPVFISLLMTSIMGALIGFLFYNFNPARIYMGDSGSYFLGFLLATTSLTAPLQKTSTAVSLLVPMVALGLPIFDTLFSMLRRYLERRPLFSADRGHLHHRLLDLGITHRRAVMSLYGVSILFSGLAIAIALGRSWEIGIALVGATLVVFGLVRVAGYMEYVSLRQNRAPWHGDPLVVELRRSLPLVIRQRSPSGVVQLGQLMDQLVNLEPLQEIWIEEGSSRIDLASAAAAPRRLRNRQSKRYAIAGASFLVVASDRDQRPQPHVEVLLQLLADALAARLPELREQMPMRPISSPATSKPS